MKTIRLISTTPLQELEVETIDGVEFPSIKNSGEIEVVVEIIKTAPTGSQEILIVSRVINDFDLFKDLLE